MKKNYFFLLVLFCLSIKSYPQYASDFYSVTQLWMKNSINHNVKNQLNGHAPVDFRSSFTKLFSKGIVGNSSTLFVVYHCQDRKDQKLLQVAGPKDMAVFTSYMTYGDSMTLNKGNIAKGVIVNYNINQLVSKPERTYFILENPDGKKQGADSASQTAVFETIFINKPIGNNLRTSIAAYLSVKYGISLDNPAHYIINDSVIWNAKVNNAYNGHIFGLGRNDYFKLYQPASVNSENEDLRMSLVDSTYFKQDNTFILAGSNRKKMVFGHKKTADGYQVLEKKWLLQRTGTPENRVNFQFEGALQKDTVSAYFLVFDTQDTFERMADKTLIKGYRKGNRLVFDEVNLKETGGGHSYFTLVKKALLEVSFEVKENCFNTPEVTFTAANAVLPLRVAYKDQTGTTVSKTLHNTVFTLTDIHAGTPDLLLTDHSGQTFTVTAPLGTGLAAVEVTLPNIWELTGKDVVLFPTITQHEDDIVSYQWWYENRQVGTKQQLTATREGTYKLQLTSKSGCVYELETVVLAKPKNADEKPFEQPEMVTASGSWEVYPNPAAASQPFYAAFNLETEASVTVYLYTLEGRYITSADLGRVTRYNWACQIGTPGTYLVVAVIDHKAEMKKVILK